MRIKLVLLAVISFFAANTAIAAESAPKEESTGFGAGAAEAGLATYMSSGEPQILAQEVNQQ